MFSVNADAGFISETSCEVFYKKASKNLVGFRFYPIFAAELKKQPSMMRK